MYLLKYLLCKIYEKSTNDCLNIFIALKSKFFLRIRFKLPKVFFLGNPKFWKMHAKQCSLYRNGTSTTKDQILIPLINWYFCHVNIIMWHKRLLKVLKIFVTDVKWPLNYWHNVWTYINIWEMSLMWCKILVFKKDFF